MAQEGVKNKRKLAMLQGTLTHQIEFVVEQMIFAYVTYRQSASCDPLLRRILLKLDTVYSLAVIERDPYDLRQNASALFPPEYYVDFLQQVSIQKKIGAEVLYQECPDAPLEPFVKTGDVRFNIYRYDTK